MLCLFVMKSLHALKFDLKFQIIKSDIMTGLTLHDICKCLIIRFKYRNSAIQIALISRFAHVGWLTGP